MSADLYHPFHDGRLARATVGDGDEHSRKHFPEMLGVRRDAQEGAQMDRVAEWTQGESRVWVWVAQGDSLAQARRMWLRLGHCCPSCGGDRQTESATCQWLFQHITSHLFHRLTASSPGYKVPSSEVNLCTTHSKSYVLEPCLTPVLWTVPGGRLSQESLKTFSHPLHREIER